MKRRQRVMAWNVGRIYSPRGRNWLADSDVPRVAATIAELLPDVVLLQELADGAQLERLMAALAAPAVAARLGEPFEGVLADRCGYDRQSAALVRRSLHPAFEQLELGATKRGVVAATFDALDGNGRSAALTLHFDAFRRSIRRRQAEALVRLAEARPEPVVLMGGDFNYDPALSARLRDHVDSGTATLLRSRFIDAGARSGPTLFQLLRFDHILLRGVAPDDFYAKVVPRRLPWGDHAPLVVDLHHPRASQLRRS